MTRTQLLERFKQRAREKVEEGLLHEAVASICADLAKYPDLRPSSEDVLMGVAAIKEGRERVLEYIEGFQ